MVLASIRCFIGVYSTSTCQNQNPDDATLSPLRNFCMAKFKMATTDIHIFFITIAKDNIEHCFFGSNYRFSWARTLIENTI